MLLSHTVANANTTYSFIIHRRLLLAYLLNCTQGREGGRQQQARLEDTRTQKYNTLAYVRVFQKTEYTYDTFRSVH